METIFQQCSYKKPSRTKKNTVTTNSISNKSELDLKIIEKQLNEYLQAQKGKNTNRVTLNNYNENTQYNEEKFGEIVDAEIKRQYTNKKWKSLPKFLQWKLVQEYAKENNLNIKVQNDLKKKIDQNLLDVEYNIQDTKIVSIDINP